MNPYSDMLGLLAGAREEEPGVELGTVRSVDPVTLYVGGTVITQNIQGPPFLMEKWPEDIPVSDAMAAYLEHLRLAPGDTVAVRRKNEINTILCKVVKV